MRRALAAVLLSCTLAVHAQAPPVAPPPGDTQPAAPSPERESPQNPPAAGETPPAQASPAPAAERPPARPAAPKAPRAPAPAPTPKTEESPRDAELAALRAQVSRLQSELDAERAAAVPAQEEAAPEAPPARSPWAWLVVTALLALAAGFLLGWRLLDRRIRARYGGLRIY